METLIYFVIALAIFAVLVWGGFKVIAMAGLHRAVGWVFAVIVLIVIVYALMALTRGQAPIEVDLR